MHNVFGHALSILHDTTCPLESIFYAVLKQRIRKKFRLSNHHKKKFFPFGRHQTTTIVIEYKILGRCRKHAHTPFQQIQCPYQSEVAACQTATTRSSVPKTKERSQEQFCSTTTKTVPSDTCVTQPPNFRHEPLTSVRS